MIAKAVRGRPPLPARKLHVCLPAGGTWKSEGGKGWGGAGPGRGTCTRSRGGGGWVQRTRGGEPSRCRPEPRRADRVDGAATGVETDMVGFCLSRRGRAPRRTLGAVTRVTAATRRAEWTRVTSL